MKLSFIAALLFVANLLNSQESRFGTLVIAAIGSDGIVIGADSRTMVGEAERIGDKIVSSRITSYQDSSQKIFIINHTAIGVTGMNTFKGGVTMESLVKKYNNFPIDTIRIQYRMGNFVQTILNSYPIDSSYSHSQFITGFYLNNKPNILVGWYFHLSESPVYDSFYVSDINARPVFKKYCKYNRNLTCGQLKGMIEKTIIEFGKKHNKTVGGAVSIYKIDKNNKVTCLKNDFSKKPLGGTIHKISKSDTAFNRVIRSMTH